tara:strand:- start:145 stop:732 length:588 start_codon:yes stop_codon:yes gene_type:complete
MLGRLMADISIEEFARRIDDIRKNRLYKALHQFAVKKAARAEKFAKKNAKENLRVRTGRLRSSIQARVIPGRPVTGFELRAGGGSAQVSYARIHEYGGTIRPRNSKFLAIPVNDKLFTGTGASRYPSARRAPFPLAYAQSRKGQPLLLHEVTGEVFYILKKMVKIEARPYMRPAVDKINDEIQRQILPLIAGKVF